MDSDRIKLPHKLCVCQITVGNSAGNIYVGGGSKQIPDSDGSKMPVNAEITLRTHDKQFLPEEGFSVRNRLKCKSLFSDYLPLQHAALGVTLLTPNTSQDPSLNCLSAWI